VHPALVGALGVGAGGFALVALRAVARSQRMRVATGPEALIGLIGVARTGIGPQGVVRVHNEDWKAITDGGPIDAGQTVRVMRVEGVTVIVRPVDQPAEASPGVATR
jgi:membrane-bound serine protease (ClpP class)